MLKIFDSAKFFTRLNGHNMTPRERTRNLKGKLLLVLGRTKHRQTLHWPIVYVLCEGNMYTKTYSTIEMLNNDWKFDDR